MSRLTNPDYAEEHPVRWTLLGLSAGWLAVIALVLLCGLLSIGLWAFGVFTSDLKGRGDALKQKNSANNRIFAQQHFETLFGDIKAADAKLSQADRDRKDNPGSIYYQTNYDGLVNVCIDDVTQYNQDARKYLLQDFRTADLPAQIDSNDPTTDCQPGS